MDRVVIASTDSNWGLNLSEGSHLKGRELLVLYGINVPVRDEVLNLIVATGLIKFCHSHNKDGFEG